MEGGQTSGRQEGGRSCRLVVGLVEELLAGGREDQAAGCLEEGRTWDQVVVMVVDQAAGHQEGL